MKRFVFLPRIFLAGEMRPPHHLRAPVFEPAAPRASAARRCFSGPAGPEGLAAAPAARPGDPRVSGLPDPGASAPDLAA